MLSHVRDRKPRHPAAPPATAAGLLALVVVVTGLAASAQTAGVISGRVDDPHGRPVPGAVSTLIDPRRDARQQVTSDENGRFAFENLSPGDYVLETARPGFRTASRRVTLRQAGVTLEIPLAVGSLSESISITAPPETRAAALEPPRAAVHAARVRPGASHMYVPVECTPSARGGEIRPPTKRKSVNPVYPDNPDGSLQGVVVLEGWIATDGKVTGTKVVRSADPALSRAAIEAWEQWEFTPTLLNCVPIEVAMTATFDFSVSR